MAILNLSTSNLRRHLIKIMIKTRCQMHLRRERKRMKRTSMRIARQSLAFLKNCSNLDICVNAICNFAPSRVSSTGTQTLFTMGRWQVYTVKSSFGTPSCYAKATLEKFSKEAIRINLKNSKRCWTMNNKMLKVKHSKNNCKINFRKIITLKMIKSY